MLEGRIESLKDEDERLKELFFRYRARNFPATLSEEARLAKARLSEEAVLLRRRGVLTRATAFVTALFR